MLGPLLGGNLWAEGQTPSVDKPLVFQSPLWEQLIEKGDPSSLNKAKDLIVSLQGEEKVKGLQALMASGVKGLSSELKGLKLSPKVQMKMAWHARSCADVSLAPILMTWIESSSDAFVQEYALLSLQTCGDQSVVERLKALKAKGQLPRFAAKALDDTLQALEKKS